MAGQLRHLASDGRVDYGKGLLVEVSAGQEVGRRAHLVATGSTG
jgi:hypothetical protein